MFKSLLVAIFMLISINLQAQTWEVGGFGGGAGYMGDLNQQNPFKFSDFAGGAFVKRNLDRYLALKLSYTYGVIKGDDAKSSNLQDRDRNLSFKTTLNEVSLTGEFNFMEYVPSVTINRYTPYIFAGIGYAAYNPQASYLGQVYDLRDLQTEGKSYQNNTIAVPFGVGFKYNIGGKLTLGAELGYRTAYTDYLDDVSGVYADKTKFATNPVALALSDRTAGQTAVTGSQRGDLRPHDTYLFAGFTLSYTFVTQKCYY
jgi:hypothetical protein